MRQAKLFFETTCCKYGCVDEAKFILGSTHLKQVCNSCGFYQKFFDKSQVPTVFDIKNKIWYIVESDKAVIEEAKREVEFIEGLKGLPQQIIYWKLYLEIRKKLLNNAIS